MSRHPSPRPILVLLVLGAALSVWTACSMKPSASDAEAIVHEQIAREAEGRIQLNSLRKTNGIEGVRDGTPLYTLEYEAELEFLADCKWLSAGIDEPTRHDGFKTAPTDDEAEAKKGFWRSLANSVLSPGTDQKKGEKVPYSGKILFGETEKGWRPVPPAE